MNNEFDLKTIQLLKEIKENNSKTAFTTLVEMVWPYLYSSSISLRSKNREYTELTVDDYLSVYIDCLIHSIDNFDVDRGVPFLCYLRKVGDNNCIKMIKKAKQKRFLEPISLDECPKGAEDLDNSYHEILSEKVSSYDDIDSKEVYLAIRENKNSIWSEDERKVILYRINGFSNIDISHEMNCKVKRVRYLYSSALSKYRSLKMFRNKK